MKYGANNVFFLQSTNVLVEGEGEGEPYPVVKLTDFNFYYKKPTTVFEINSSWLAPVSHDKIRSTLITYLLHLL
jgi:hypothetical protein